MCVRWTSKNMQGCTHHPSVCFVLDIKETRFAVTLRSPLHRHEKCMVWCATIRAISNETRVRRDVRHRIPTTTIRGSNQALQLWPTTAVARKRYYAESSVHTKSRRSISLSLSLFLSLGALPPPSLSRSPSLPPHLRSTLIYVLCVGPKMEEYEPRKSRTEQRSKASAPLACEALCKRTGGERLHRNTPSKGNGN